MGDKLNTFMLSGVEEYWVVDPKNNRVMVYNFKQHDIIRRLALAYLILNVRIS